MIEPMTLALALCAGLLLARFLTLRLIWRQEIRNGLSELERWLASTTD